MSSKIIGAVDIGTSKVVVLIGEILDGSSLNIIGMAESTSYGMRKGEVVDLRAVSDCTHAAIIEAEKRAGAQIEGIYLSQSGGHLQGFNNVGVVTVSDPLNRVSEDDVRRAEQNAKSKVLANDRVYIHHVRSGFALDGRPIEQPVQMVGDKLEVTYWHIHGDKSKISDQIHVINGIGLDVDDMIVSSIAVGSMVATEPEKHSGVLVVDIGCGTTDYALFRGGRILRTGVIPVGGDHLSNDLSIGLRLSQKNAERIKLRDGKAMLEKDDKHANVMMVGDMMIGDRIIPKASIGRILQARVEEIFTILKNKLGSALSPQNLPAGIILTGGTSKLPLIDEVARNLLGVEVRCGRNPDWISTGELRDPIYSTSLGLLYYGLTAQRTPVSKSHNPPKRKSRLLGSLTGFFK
ncbi:MAG: cell division protein FtsA [Verrucomicrobia bacterium]|nr:cell division protein FtsA [Verrucomicrobiota bacterium]